MSYLDSRYRVHLEWMFENQPSLVRELHRKNKLKDHLDDKEQQALALVIRLRDGRGMSEQEAFEVAMSQILATPDGPAMSDSPPRPMPEPERKAVYRHLEKLGDLQDEEELKQAQKH